MPLRTSLARLDEALGDMHDTIQVAHGRHWRIVVDESALSDGKMANEILGRFASRQEAVAVFKANAHWHLGYQGVEARKIIVLCDEYETIARCDKDGFFLPPITDEDIPF